MLTRKLGFVIGIVFSLGLLFTSCDWFGPKDDPNTVTDIDGNVYQIVTIGDQVWMAENLKTTHYRNGTEILNSQSVSEWGDDTTGAYCAYDNNEEYADTFGYLYNWFAVTNENELAPEGWHIPSDEEWKQLEIFLGMSQAHADSFGYRGTIEANKLKTTSGYYVDRGTDDFGFTILPCGCRDAVYNWHTAEFIGMNTTAEIWTSTENGEYFAWNRRFGSDGGIFRWDVILKWRGNSVRCVKDTVSS